jgi:hypothetical protein
VILPFLWCELVAVRFPRNKEELTLNSFSLKINLERANLRYVRAEFLGARWLNKKV